jgi:transposase
VPPAAQRELRDVVRYRKRLIEDRAREANRLQKILETANIKLASVVTDVLGVSARAMLKALIAGTIPPRPSPSWAQRRMRRKRAALGEGHRPSPLPAGAAPPPHPVPRRPHRHL